MNPRKPSQDAAYKVLNKDQVVANGKRANSSVVENLTRLGFQQLGENVEGCATWLRYELLDTVDDHGVPNAALVDANFCRVRGCRVCDRRRQQKWRARLHDAATTINHPERWIGFTTLTVRNPEIAQLRQSLDRLNTGWINLKKQRWWNRTIIGCVKTLEITWGKDDRPHPHFHLLQWQHPNATGSRKVATDQIRAHWRSAIGADYDPVVHRSKIYSHTGNTGDAIREAVKYVSKTGYQLEDFDRFACVWTALRGRRMITPTGIVRKALAEQKNYGEEDLIRIRVKDEDRGQPLGVALEFRWNAQIDGYTISSVG